MALVKVKPTSPGRRAMVKVVNSSLYKGRPVAALTEKKSKTAGRNHTGQITMRHMGGGHKQHYRVIDFKRNKDGIPAKVERIEYDPNRTANIALLCYADGERRYISYAQVRLRSGEVRKIHVECRATIGEVGNEEHNLRSIGKAGAVRWRGIRPTVRGVAMNPIDHPHGGGEGRTSAGQHPVSPWGVLTKGYRTRSNKRTAGMIVTRRYQK